MNLAKKILTALALGVIVGLIINNFFPQYFEPLDGYLFTPLGTIFLNLIKMVIVPLVFFSIVSGVANIGDPKKLGRIGAKTMLFFLLSTAIAITIGIVLALLIKPGMVGSFQTENLSYEATEAPPASETFLGIIPTNPIAAMASGAMLQIIFFAVFIGYAISVLGKKVETVAKVLEQGNQIMMFLVNLVMKFAPYGTFGLIASAIGSLGWNALKAMLLYMLVVLLALAIHFIFVYGGALKFMANRNPVTVIKAFLPAMAVSFSTSSSSATLPVAMEIAQKKLRVPRSISSFVQPLGATINMDGTAIMQGVATIFIAQVFDVNLSLIELVTVVLTAVLASIGTAAVPGAGLIMLAMVLTAVGLPVEGIALIIGIDRLLDMTRTMVNSTGDLTCTLYVTNSEQKKGEVFDDIYDDTSEKPTN
ncbi:dicarboxylate/amino acid:cation symporter [Kurthia sibirica]|uniref:Dicarboxylate/amino acid:cation symporter n=1 Tax=Kurthia sibirica TaxID=202750 RepID=A0A2U3AP39_9BACL|nr:dicarboxylate/amino acid:cation symporter [Kurthia sibirica]PWI26269.1 dicarboxylate/amino acid:cation symporter [Kurthia sibirica]GEK33884.1 sodium:dicarboxylate symporter [Kurthia sibirica]